MLMGKLFCSLFIFYFFSFRLFSQSVPNEGFENWSTAFGVDYPDHWATSDQLYFFKGLNMNTVSKTIDARFGYYSLKMWPDTGKKQLLPSYISAKFGYAARPKLFTFYHKDSLTSKENAYVIVKLRKWNKATKKSDSIGGIKWIFPKIISSDFTKEILTLGYTSTDTTIIPDTAELQFTVSTSTQKRSQVGSVKIDVLYFGNSAGIENINVDALPVSFYPNPAGDIINFQLAGAGNCTCELYDINGRLCRKTIINDTQPLVKTLSLDGVGNGVYFVRLSATGAIYSGKVLIQR